MCLILFLYNLKNFNQSFSYITSKLLIIKKKLLLNILKLEVNRSFVSITCNDNLTDNKGCGMKEEEEMAVTKCNSRRTDRSYTWFSFCLELVSVLLVCLMFVQIWVSTDCTKDTLLCKYFIRFYKLANFVVIDSSWKLVRLCYFVVVEDSLSLGYPWSIWFNTMSLLEFNM